MGVGEGGGARGRSPPPTLFGKRFLGPLSIIERAPLYFEKTYFAVVFTKQMVRTKQEKGPQCIELKSFKLYLRCFRNAGHFHEDVTNRMLSKFVEAIQPVWMEVRGEFNVRGGVATTVTARHGELPENLAGIEPASWNGPN